MEIVVKDKENNIIFSSGKDDNVGYIEIAMDIYDILKVKSGIESKLFNNATSAYVCSLNNKEIMNG